MARKLKLATAQFAVANDITANCDTMIRLIEEASNQNIELFHFSECCLTGYPDIDIAKCENTTLITDSIKKIAAAAKKYNTSVVFGTHYYDKQDDRLPFNSSFVINNYGETIVRYDKRILAGAPGEIDKKHYRAGSSPALFSINEIKCGLIICHEWRYPELFREYKALGAEIIFHSFYDGNLAKDNYQREGRELGELISGAMRDRAANNYLWISTSNTSKPEQTFASAHLQPDGSIHSVCKRNETQIIISEFDLGKQFIDPSKYGRKRIAELYPKGILR